MKRNISANDQQVNSMISLVPSIQGGTENAGKLRMILIEEGIEVVGKICYGNSFVRLP